MLFFQFLTHPRPRIIIFFDFLFIRVVGKLFFSVFHSSEVSDNHFFDFLFIRVVGKLFFSVSHSSEASDGHFFTSVAPSKLNKLSNRIHV